MKFPRSIKVVFSEEFAEIEAMLTDEEVDEFLVDLGAAPSGVINLNFHKKVPEPCFWCGQKGPIDSRSREL